MQTTDYEGQLKQAAADLRQADVDRKAQLEEFKLLVREASAHGLGIRTISASSGYRQSWIWRIIRGEV